MIKFPPSHLPRGPFQNNLAIWHRLIWQTNDFRRNFLLEQTFKRSNLHFLPKSLKITCGSL